MTHTFTGTPAYTYGPWTPHDDGPCPVPGDTRVQVRLARESRNDVELDTPLPADFFVWEAANEPNPLDRIAEYRVARPITVEDL